MKLKDCIENFKDKDNIKIGMQSGFVFIGDYEEYERNFKNISDEWLERAKNTVQSRGRIFKGANPIIELTQYKENLNNVIEDFNKGKISFDKAQERIDKLENSTLKKAKTTIARFRDIPRSIIKSQHYIDTFSPFEEREVIEHYESDVMDNTIIIHLEGDEVGDVWLKEEYDRLYRGAPYAKRNESND